MSLVQDKIADIWKIATFFLVHLIPWSTKSNKNKKDFQQPLKNFPIKRKVSPIHSHIHSNPFTHPLSYIKRVYLSTNHLPGNKQKCTSLWVSCTNFMYEDSSTFFHIEQHPSHHANPLSLRCWKKLDGKKKFILFLTLLLEIY